MNDGDEVSLIFIILVTAMDLFVTAVAVFFCSAITQAQEFLRTRGGDIDSIPSNSSENNNSRILALLIVEENDSEESENAGNGKHKPPIILPWIDAANLDGKQGEDMDTSGESNADEYPDSNTADTDSESNFYHENNYKDSSNVIDLAELKHFKDKSDFLRKRWKSCRKTAAKVCKEACILSYKNACDEHKCGSKLKNEFKKQCKRNCKDLFM